MAYRPKVMYELIDRRVEEWGWRESTYRRGDGSTFHVAVPPMVEIEDGQPGRRTYNDYAEHKMAMRLAVGGDS